MDKVDHPVKKLKVVLPTVGEMPPATQLPPSPRHGIGKGLMKAKSPVAKKRPLLREIRDTPLANCHASSRTMIIRT